MSNQELPRTIDAYLKQLKRELHGADKALIQDALYDAEEYLRNELRENPDKTEADLLGNIAATYGAPAEVADAYRQTEKTVQAALRTPRVKARTSVAGRFFGVMADPSAWTAMLYLALGLPVGVFFFTWAVTGLALSVGFSILPDYRPAVFSALPGQRATPGVCRRTSGRSVARRAHAAAAGTPGAAEFVFQADHGNAQGWPHMVHDFLYAAQAAFRRGELCHRGCRRRGPDRIHSRTDHAVWFRPTRPLDQRPGLPALVWSGRNGNFGDHSVRRDDARLPRSGPCSGLPGPCLAGQDVGSRSRRSGSIGGGGINANCDGEA